jgi:signal transduction histidine kinase
VRDLSGTLTGWLGVDVEIDERKRSQDQLLLNQSYLAEAQKLSQTGNFGWQPASGELMWSDETFRIFNYDATVTPTLDLIFERVHPEDVALVKTTLEAAKAAMLQLDLEHRLLMPDGAVKYLHVKAQPLLNASGTVEFVGAVSDITAAKLAEEKVRRNEMQLQQIISNIRLEARVNERMRIARDLHDTLLQSFQGLLLRFQTVSNLLPTRPVEAKKTLDGAIEQASEAIIESRDAIEQLRSSTAETGDLAVAIRGLGQEFQTFEGSANSASYDVAVEGAPRELQPICRDEIYRIAGEALRNAFRHAQARQIEVELGYGDEQFRLRVRDNGKGIDASLLTEHERTGHYGLRGMRERARLLGGNLTVRSQFGSGTELELIVAASRAYATSSAPHYSWFAQTLSGQDIEKNS